ncbi:MAG: ATP-binding cassette domain-containing protein [Polyangiaceae bacterium]|nr:ATP-binding cassette domain-containing protein [Polyangiaceae bacterium]
MAAAKAQRSSKVRCFERREVHRQRLVVRARLLLLPTVLLELGARLTLFGSLFALFSSVDAVRHAALLAALASVAAFIRTWWRGTLLGLHIDALYDRVIRAVAAKPTAALTSNREHGQAAALVDAIYEVATLNAVSVPDFFGCLGAVGVVLVVVALRFGVVWLGVGALVAVALLVAFAPARRAAQRARERGWRSHMRTAKLLDTLIFGSAELRASGRATAMGRKLAAEGNIVATAERSGVRLGAITAVIPAVLAAALLALPSSWLGELFGSRSGEVAVLAGVGLSYGLTLVSAAEAITRSAPVRATLNGFIGEDGGPDVAPMGTQRADSNGSDDGAEPITNLELAAVSVRYEGATTDTPQGLSFSLDRGGLALVGPNGAGKTTALLAAIGLVPIRAGSVRLNGSEAVGPSWERLRRRAILIAQRPHVVPDEDVAWHVGLFGTAPVDGDKLAKALDRVGLAGLRSRAEAQQRSVSALPMGELSGGEQRRVALARALVHEVDLVLVDEPEAGLDHDGRLLVGKLLHELAQVRLVLVVAHDTAVVPPSFARVDLGAKEQERKVPEAVELI